MVLRAGPGRLSGLRVDKFMLRHLTETRCCYCYSELWFHCDCCYYWLRSYGDLCVENSWCCTIPTTLFRLLAVARMW